MHILKHANAEINRGDKIALIGANGKGKSTLLRLIAQTEKCGGEIVPGHNVQPSFYAQHQVEALNLNDDILDELKHCGSGKTELELRELMGCFLFKGDDVFKKIRILSGGEKARVALAKTILSKSNFILLDEPTNHLDITSVNMLIQALNQFEGTFILVSHDRYFIQNTATKIWEIEDGQINQFDGNYTEWEEFKKRKALAAKKQTESTIPVVKEVVVEVPKESSAPKSNTSEFKEKQKEEKRIRSKFNKLEEELNKLNEKKSGLEQLLSDPSTYADKHLFQSTEAEYNLVSSKVAQLQPEYEQLFEQLLEFES